MAQTSPHLHLSDVTIVYIRMHVISCGVLAGVFVRFLLRFCACAVREDSLYESLYCDSINRVRKDVAP